MAVQIQIRRGTAANWTSANPTLAEGELGYETDTGKLKAGDGSTAWTSLSYISGTGGSGGDLVDDTTPQLGGDLDVNGNAIVSVSNGDIAITPNGTGSIILDGLTWPSADGTANQVLKTAGDGTLSFGDASSVAALNDLTDVSVGSEHRPTSSSIGADPAGSTIRSTTPRSRAMSEAAPRTTPAERSQLDRSPM
jgi:hypothetical protein